MEQIAAAATGIQEAVTAAHVRGEQPYRLAMGGHLLDFAPATLRIQCPHLGTVLPDVEPRPPIALDQAFLPTSRNAEAMKYPRQSSGSSMATLARRKNSGNPAARSGGTAWKW